MYDLSIISVMSEDTEWCNGYKNAASWSKTLVDLNELRRVLTQEHSGEEEVLCPENSEQE